MSAHDLHVNPPLTRIEMENIQAQLIDRVPGEARHVDSTPEQVRAADEVFNRDRESEQVLGMLGMWTGALVLHDVAKDTFTTDEEEDEPKKNEDGEEL